MFFAGHETTATVMVATLCFLASHKEEQEIVLEEIRSLVSDGELPFAHYESLVKTRSAFVEALRMIPAGSLLVRESRDDTILHVPAGMDANENMIQEAVPIPKGTTVIVDMIGIRTPFATAPNHVVSYLIPTWLDYNPRTFPDPGVYRPSRWYQATSEEAYTAFSVGPRACIGRRFALTEGICFLAHLLRDYEVKPLLEKGETLQSWKERVLTKTVSRLSLQIVNTPLLFKRR